MPRRILLAPPALFCAIWILDFAWFHARLSFPAFGAAQGFVHRIRVLAIPGKLGKTEFQIDAVQPEEDLPCSHSFFPHAHSNPCWYVVRQAKDPIQM